MFKNKTIHKGVMKVIKDRIKQKQEDYNTQIFIIEDSHIRDIERLVDEKEEKKAALADQMINDIVGKII